MKTLVKIPIFDRENPIILSIDPASISYVLSQTHPETKQDDGTIIGVGGGREIWSPLAKTDLLTVLGMDEK